MCGHSWSDDHVDANESWPSSLYWLTVMPNLVPIESTKLEIWSDLGAELNHKKHPAISTVVCDDGRIHQTEMTSFTCAFIFFLVPEVPDTTILLCKLLLATANQFLTYSNSFQSKSMCIWNLFNSLIYIRNHKLFDELANKQNNTFKYIIKKCKRKYSALWNVTRLWKCDSIELQSKYSHWITLYIFLYQYCVTFPCHRFDKRINYAIGFSHFLECQCAMHLHILIHCKCVRVYQEHQLKYW